MQLRSPLHILRKESIVCTFLACQLWEWYPLFHCIVHALQPTGLFVLDSTLKLPRDIAVTIKNTPSTYTYVEAIQKEEESKKKLSKPKFSFQENRLSPLTISRSLRKSQSARRYQETHSVSEETKEVKTTTETTETKDVKEPEEFVVTNGNRMTLQQIKDMVVPDMPYQFVIHPPSSMQGDCSLGIYIVRKNPNHFTSYLDLKNDDGLPEPTCPPPFVYEIPPNPNQ